MNKASKKSSVKKTDSMNDMHMEHMVRMHGFKLRSKQRIMFRAFLINYVLIFITWLLSMSDGFMNWVANLTNMPFGLLTIQMISWMAMWKIAGVVLFLVPALAACWEMAMLKRYSKE
ncbi:MAG: hypothetical protein LBF37_02925 [Rickettsiales bacterium]|jgi:hypothetical protein|nr:hypothetical protein [Rickettsiales bacterium]